MVEKALKYPVTTLMIYAAIILLGLISFRKLPVALLPEIEFPEITIVTGYESASPREIEHLVTKQIEEAIASVAGVKNISSISSEGISIVKVKFIWGKDMDFAAMEVREKVDLIKGSLPQDVKRPIILKYNPSDTPIMSISVSSPSLDKIELRKAVEKEIKSALERVDGVAAVNITGGLIREIKINIDAARLYGNNLSIPEVIDALNLANYNYPAGSIKKEKKEFIVRVIGEFKDISEVKNLIVATGEKDQPIYLKDIAEVADGFKERTSSSHFNALEDINLSVQKEALKNTIDVNTRLLEEIGLLKEKFQGRIKINVIYSQAEFIGSAIGNLISSAIQGGMIAFFVLLLFLKDMKTSLIIMISIPISVLATFIFMFLRNISLNMISMGGLAIGVGMMVDTSIVVIESIDRKMKSQAGLLKNITDGTNEVRTSVIGSVLTTVVVFLPIIFVKGIAGAVFGQLAFTISVSLMISLYVSLTLVPLLYSLPFKTHFKLPFTDKFLEYYDKFEDFYITTLKSLIPLKRTIIYTGPLVLLIGIILFLLIKKELLPPVDQGKFKIRIEASIGTPFPETERYVSFIEDQLLKYKKSIKSICTVIGYDEKNIVFNQTERMNINVALLDIILRKRGHTHEFIQQLKSALQVPGSVKLNFLTVQEILPGISSYQKKDYLVAVKANDIQELRDISDGFEQYLKKQKDITDVANESGEPSMEYHLQLDRDAMSSLGLNVKLVAETLQAAIKGKRATFLRDLDDEYDIKVRLQENDRLDKNFLQKLFIKNSLFGINVPLSSFAQLLLDKGENTLFREDQQRVMYHSFNYQKSKGRLLGLIKNFKQPADASITLTGVDKETKESINELIFAFILSIVLVYMIMAAQFESLGYPLILMFSTPLTIAGVAAGLLLTGTSINVISAIGLILLSGIVVDNAIVLFEYFQILKQRGKSLVPAVLESCKIRMRPVIMTTLTTIVGLVPLILNIGNGSEIQRPMAITVISGLIFGTILTLIYIPLVYIAVEERKKLKNR